LKAILKWKFKPKLVDGQPVERQATQEIEFKLAR
jgi:protein TonB